MSLPRSEEFGDRRDPRQPHAPKPVPLGFGNGVGRHPGMHLRRRSRTAELVVLLVGHLKGEGRLRCRQRAPVRRQGGEGEGVVGGHFNREGSLLARRTGAWDENVARRQPLQFHRHAHARFRSKNCGENPLDGRVAVRTTWCTCAIRALVSSHERTRGQLYQRASRAVIRFLTASAHTHAYSLPSHSARTLSPLLYAEPGFPSVRLAAGVGCAAASSTMPTWCGGALGWRAAWQKLRLTTCWRV
eukprot:scaffold232456_cov33-Tisochrysis_lutea.AAC.6